MKVVISILDDVFKQERLAYGTEKSRSQLFSTGALHLVAKFFWIVAVTLSTGILLGQEKLNVNMVTVCEVLGDLRHYTNTDVAIVGRMERNVSLIDHYEFISQDHCEHPVITHGYLWSNKIQILTGEDAGILKPPGDEPKLAHSAIIAKLSIIRKTTKLGFHQEPRFRADGRVISYSHMASVPNEWAVVYGRIMTVPKLDEDCGSEGCGGDDFPLIVIAESYNIHRLDEDATPLPAEGSKSDSTKP